MLTRRKFLGLAGTSIVIFTIPFAGCQVNRGDTAGSPNVEGVPGDALLDESGEPLLTQDGSYLLTG
jgi:hypothetical protein